MRLSVLFVAAALLSASLAAHANVIYSYVGAGVSAGTTFTIDSPDYLTYNGSNAAVPVTTSSDLFNGPNDFGSLLSVAFFQNSFQGNSASNHTATLFGGPYTINQDGVYTSNSNAQTSGATLTISGSPTVASVAVTPEPTSIVLLGTGLLGLAGLVRRRRV